MIRSHPSALLAVAVVLALSLLPGCSLIRAAEGAPATYDGPGEPNLTAERVWGAPRVVENEAIALLDDAVILSDEKRSAFMIGEDGKERWQLPRQLKLTDEIEAAMIGGFGTNADGRSDVVVGTYRWDSCEADLNECYEQDKIPSPEYGVAAFSTADGSFQWSTVLVPSERHEPGEPPKTTGFGWSATVVTESAVLTEISPDIKAPREEIRTIALDPRTGAELWSLTGVQVDGASGDRLIGGAIRPGSGDLSDYEAYPVVLEARTGREIWRGTEVGLWHGPGGWNLRLTAGGYAAVLPIRKDRSAAPSPRAIVVDLTTGDTHPVHHGGAVGRDASGPFYAWIKIDNDRTVVVSSAMPPDTPRAGSEDIGPSRFMGTVGGYLWAHTGPDDEPATTALDRTGAQRLEPVPGLPEAVNENWLITKVSKPDRFTAYRLSS